MQIMDCKVIPYRRPAEALSPTHVFLSALSIGNFHIELEDDDLQRQTSNSEWPPDKLTDVLHFWDTQFYFIFCISFIVFNFHFHFIPYSLGCGANCDSSDILAH